MKSQSKMTVLMLMVIVAANGLASDSEPKARTLNGTCSLLGLFGGGQFYSLDPIFAKLGIAKEKFESSKTPVLVDPKAGYVRYFVTRTVDVGDLKMEVSAFENEAGVFPGLVDAAKSQNIWPTNLSVPEFRSANLNAQDLLAVQQFQAQFAGLPLEKQLALIKLAQTIESPGLKIASGRIDEVGNFIGKQEIRRNWTPSFYERLEKIRYQFAGSTTTIVIRDKSTGAIVASLKFVRAPFGGRTYVDLSKGQPLAEDTYGAWGPTYKNLAAPSIPMMTAEDEFLYQQSLQMRKFSNHVLVPRMAWENYVPPEITIDRAQFRGHPYRTAQDASKKQIVFYWQHEFIEPSGFAIDPDYADRHHAYSLLVSLTLSQLLDPRYSHDTNMLDRTYLFPNDPIGVRMYAKLGFKPTSGKFSMFGMNDWVLLKASGEEFAGALREILENKDQAAANREIRDLVRAVLNLP
jgi:hypothetical protein